MSKGYVSYFFPNFQDRLNVTDLESFIGSWGRGEDEQSPPIDRQVGTDTLCAPRPALVRDPMSLTACLLMCSCAVMFRPFEIFD